MHDKLLTPNDVLEYLNITRQDLIQLIRDEKMPFIRIGGQARFRAIDLEPWLESNTATIETQPQGIDIVEQALGINSKASGCKFKGKLQDTEQNAEPVKADMAPAAPDKQATTTQTNLRSTRIILKDPLPITDPYLVFMDADGLALKIFMKKSAEPHRVDITSLVKTLYPHKSVEPLVAQAFETPGQPVRLGRVPQRLSSPVNLIVTRDKLNAFLFINRDAIVTGEIFSHNVLETLDAMGLHSGIQSRTITNADHPDAPGKMLLIAKGIKPKVAGDAELIVHIQTPPRFKPKSIESPKFNYQAYQSIASCHKDQVLAEIKKPELARNGVDVYGNVVSCDSVQGPLLKGGPNTYFSFDRSRLHASCDGIPYLKGGAICVDNTLYLENVGHDSGNVQAFGRVIVQGNVESGFCVDAERKVIIKGQVDAAAITSRRSSITVHQGIHGSSGASLTAASNISASFASSCTMQAGMNITINTSLVRCTVRAFKNIHLTAESSRTTSSTLVAGRCISVGSCGSKAQLRATLKIESPTDDHTGSERVFLEKQILNARNEIQQQKSRIMRLREQKSTAVNAERFTLQKMEKKLAKHEGALETFRNWLKDSDSVFIDVRDTVWPGTVIIIEDKELKITKQMKSQRFYYTHSGIKHKSI